jgi:hypothetical protein
MSKIPISVTLPFSNLIIILYLLFFGFLDFLNLAVKLIGPIIFVILFVLFYSKVKLVPKNIFKMLFSKNLLLFYAISGFTYFKSSNMRFKYWDEFSGWGAGIKSVYFFNSLGPIGGYSDLNGIEYPPMLQLYSYLLLKIHGSYSEAIIYWAYQIFVISILIAILPNIYKAQYLKHFISLILISISVFQFFPTFQTITMDPILGLLFGFSILFVSRYQYLSGIKIFTLHSLMYFGLAFSKPIGMYFAFVVFLISLSERLSNLDRTNGGTRVRTVSNSFASILPTLFVYISWKALVNKSGAIESFPIKFSNIFGQFHELLSGLFNLNSFPYLRELGNLYIRKIVSDSFVQLRLVDLTLLQITVLFTFIWLLVILICCDKKCYYKEIIELFIVNLGFILYLFILFFLYLYYFSRFEATNLASFDRYALTYIFGILIIIVGKMITFFNEHMTFVSRIQLSLIILSVFVLLSPKYLSTYLNNPNIDSEIRNNFDGIEREINESNFSKIDKVWIITQHKTGFEYYVVKYLLMPSSVNFGNFSIGEPYGPEDYWTAQGVSFGKFRNLLPDYDYVFIYESNNSFSCQFGELFNGKCEPINPGFYKVVIESNDIKLVKQ